MAEGDTDAGSGVRRTLVPPHGQHAGNAENPREPQNPAGTCESEDNLNPIGRLFYGASALICTPHALSEGNQSALGGQAGEARIRAIVEAAGFRQFRHAAESPFNLVLEARP